MTSKTWAAINLHTFPLSVMKYLWKRATLKAFPFTDISLSGGDHPPRCACVCVSLLGLYAPLTMGRPPAAPSVLITPGACRRQYLTVCVTRIQPGNNTWFVFFFYACVFMVWQQGMNFFFLIINTAVQPGAGGSSREWWVGGRRRRVREV